nr:MULTISPECIES: hypothetical protein [unclassified Bradyrhizobium]
MAVSILQDLRRHAEEPGCLPNRHAALHQPGRRCVAQRVRSDFPGQLGQIHGRFEALLHGSDRLAIELDEARVDQLLVLPTTHMSQQPGWKWSWRLTLLGGSLSDRPAVEDTPLEINV